MFPESERRTAEGSSQNRESVQTASDPNRQSEQIISDPLDRSPAIREQTTSGLSITLQNMNKTMYKTKRQNSLQNGIASILEGKEPGNRE